MASYWNNKGKIILSAKYLALCFMWFVGLILCWVFYSDNASSGTGPYFYSAHGNTSYGVNNSNIASFGYSIGNCAHCHEQHGSIGGVTVGPNNYELFMPLHSTPAEANEFCFGCHTTLTGQCGATPSGSCQVGGIKNTNYSYSYKYGGDHTYTCPDSIYSSFQFVDDSGHSQSNCNSSQGTSHYLHDVGAFMLGKWGFSSTGANLNPCDACHNPHAAQQSYPCSRPSQHSTDNNAWDVWGDNAGTIERVNVAAGNKYLAPYCYNSTTTYEPNCDSTKDGSNLTSYVYVCVDCHNTTNTIYSTRLGRNLTQISWGAGGYDAHGVCGRIMVICTSYSCCATCPSTSCPPSCQCDEMSCGYLKNPYDANAASMPNYVLNCTDCHEPHGSPNEFLLRSEVNGTNVNVANSGPIINYCWYNFCTACHTIPATGVHYDPVYYGYQQNLCTSTAYNCAGVSSSGWPGSCHRHSGTPGCCTTASCIQFF